MSADKQLFLAQFLQHVIVKLRYLPDDVLKWEAPVVNGETEDEDLTAFLQLDCHKQLRVLMDAITWVDKETFQETAQILILNILDKVSDDGFYGQVSLWQEAKLCSYVLYDNLTSRSQLKRLKYQIRIGTTRPSLFNIHCQLWVQCH